MGIISFLRPEPRKWSPARIEQRFDEAASRFSELDQGQEEIVDCSRMLNLVIETAAEACPKASHVLDVGCGAGLYADNLLRRLPNIDITLLDLSKNMLSVAVKRLEQTHTQLGINNRIRAMYGDMREVPLEEQEYDIIVASAALHHLRAKAEWEAVFEKLYRALKVNGGIWVVDIVESEVNAVRELMLSRYAEYLTKLGNKRSTQSLLRHIEKEDSPRALTYQLELLRQVGFSEVSVIHKNMCFAAFCAMKR